MKRLLHKLRLCFYLLFFDVVPFSGGRGGSKKKESARTDDIARQERERADREAADLRARQQAEASQILKRQEKEATQVLSRQEATAERLRQEARAQVVPTQLESERLSRILGLEPEVQQMLQKLMTQGVIPSATNLGPLGAAIEARSLQDLQQPREIPYEDTFGKQFQLLSEKVAADANRRGIYGSGLQLEQLGRAGIDLAVQQALARQQSRYMNEQLRQQALQNAIASQNQLLEGQRGLETISSGRRGEVQQFLRDLQALEDTRRGREIAALTGASLQGANISQTGNLTAADLARTGNLTAANLMQAGNLQGSNIVRSGQQNAFELEGTQLGRQILERQAGDAGLARIAGTALGAAAGIPFGPTGVATGAQIGGNVFGGGGSPVPVTIQAPAPGSSAGTPTGPYLRANRYRGTGYFDPYNDFNNNFGRRV